MCYERLPSGFFNEKSTNSIYFLEKRKNLVEIRLVDISNYSALIAKVYFISLHSFNTKREFL
jgi:hypothetical protein